MLVAQLLNCFQLFETPWAAAYLVPLSTVSQSLLKFMPFESIMLSNHLILCHLLFFCPQSCPVYSTQLQLLGQLFYFWFASNWASLSLLLALFSNSIPIFTSFFFSQNVVFVKIYIPGPLFYNQMKSEFPLTWTL